MNPLRPDQSTSIDARRAALDVLHLLQEMFYRPELVTELSEAALRGAGHALGAALDALQESAANERNAQ